MRKTITEIRAAGFEWPKHDAIEASAARTEDVIDLAQTIVNLEKAAAFHQRQLDDAWAFKQSARASGWVDVDYDDFTSTRDDHAANKRAHDAAIEHVKNIVSTFERKRSTLRLQPPSPTMCGEYMLDALVIERYEESGEIDFRLELGQGAMIYWALPAARNDRLRLVLVDSAVTEVDPVVVADPFPCDLKLEWKDARVAIEITQRTYRCSVEIRNRIVELRYSPAQSA